MKKFLFCFLAIIFYTNYANAQIPVCAGRPSCGPGGCGPGSCSPGSCSPGSCGPGGCGVVYGNALQYDIVNIVEQDRMYVKVRAWDRIYTLPVINGYLPEITQKTGPNDLILDYKSKIEYDREVYAGRGYVVYTLPSSDVVESKRNASDRRGVSALKGPDYIPQANKQNSNVPKRPVDDQEIDSLLNGDKKVFNSRVNDRAPRRPSDEEIDNLLNF